MFRKVLLLGLVSGLAACGSVPPPAVEDRIPTTVEIIPPTLTTPTPQPPALPSLTAASLKGLEAKGVVAMLGKPGLLRRDPPAEIWQYHGVGCVVDLFFYKAPDLANDILRVAYVQVRPLNNEGDRLDETACLSRLARPHDIKQEDGSRPAL